MRRNEIFTAAPLRRLHRQKFHFTADRTGFKVSALNGFCSLKHYCSQVEENSLPPHQNKARRELRGESVNK